MILARALTLLLLAGCAGGMTREECRETNWFQRGQLDGERGKPASQFRVYQKACGGRELVPDEVAWTKGYSEGYARYQEFHRQDLESERVRNLLLARGTRECTSDHDCNYPGSCISNVCFLGGRSCNFDSDCVVPGSCVIHTGWAGTELVTVSVCRP